MICIKKTIHPTIKPVKTPTFKESELLLFSKISSSKVGFLAPYTFRLNFILDLQFAKISTSGYSIIFFGQLFS